MGSFEALKERCPEIEKQLGVEFANKELLLLAFVHRSFFNEHKGSVKEHNERLEFLGDSVLGLIVSNHLYIHLPDRPEGELSHLRSHIVEASSCVHYAVKLGVADHILLGKGERMNDGRGRDTILADFFEALIGAIYLDRGLDAAKAFFFLHFSEEIQVGIQGPPRNYKAELQDYSQKKYQKTPEYKVLKESGPEHGKMFHVAVLLDGVEKGKGMGPSKKQAEQDAAENALRKLHG